MSQPPAPQRQAAAGKERWAPTGPSLGPPPASALPQGEACPRGRRWGGRGVTRGLRGQRARGRGPGAPPQRGAARPPCRLPPAAALLHLFPLRGPEELYGAAAPLPEQPGHVSACRGAPRGWPAACHMARHTGRRPLSPREHSGCPWEKEGAPRPQAPRERPRLDQQGELRPSRLHPEAARGGVREGSTPDPRPPACWALAHPASLPVTPSSWRGCGLGPQCPIESIPHSKKDPAEEPWLRVLPLGHAACHSPTPRGSKSGPQLPCPGQASPPHSKHLSQPESPPAPLAWSPLTHHVASAAEGSQ